MRTYLPNPGAPRERHIKGDNLIDQLIKIQDSGEKSPASNSSFGDTGRLPLAVVWLVLGVILPSLLALVFLPSHPTSTGDKS